MESNDHQHLLEVQEPAAPWQVRSCQQSGALVTSMQASKLEQEPARPYAKRLRQTDLGLPAPLLARADDALDLLGSGFLGVLGLGRRFLGGRWGDDWSRAKRRLQAPYRHARYLSQRRQHLSSTCSMSRCPAEKVMTEKHLHMLTVMHELSFCNHNVLLFKFALLPVPCKEPSDQK